MLTYLGVGLLVVIAGVLAYAATRPDGFRIERSTTIQAPAERIFAEINELQRWQGWSPWENIDPALQRSYSGPAIGVGAVYAWDGDRKVGSGRMEITESVPGSRITIKLDIRSPFEAHNTAQFTFARQGEATAVNWAMYGPSPFLSRLMGPVFSMDRMVGGQFEAGLAKLKALVER